LKAKRKSFRIFIVDDDDSVRRGLERLMRSAGHRPHSFESAERALRALGQEPPDCILLDLTMPGLGGLELQELLLRDRNRIPVIAVSARDDDDARRRSRELGAKLFLHKPVDDQALLDAIDWVTGADPTGAPHAAA
jgi:FixJ family two-component response regulator